MKKLKEEILGCRICASQFMHEPRPLFQLGTKASILIAGQAPGRRAHDSGIPWNDASGVQLRKWLGITEEQFYDENVVALLPSAFCFPGSGKSGDLPPPPICQQTWHHRVLKGMKNIGLILAIGQYGQKWALADGGRTNLTETVKAWKDYREQSIPAYPLPHPSPRNRMWMTKNPWFASKMLPELQKAVSRCLSS